MNPSDLQRMVFELMGGPEQLKPLPDDIVPLYKDPRLDALLLSLPECDEWGIRKDWAPLGVFSRLAPSILPCPPLAARVVRAGGNVGACAPNCLVDSERHGRPLLRSG